MSSVDYNVFAYRSDKCPINKTIAGTLAKNGRPTISTIYENIKHLFVSSKYWKRYRLSIEILSLERVFAKREAQ
jgi:hypothetical protein